MIKSATSLHYTWSEKKTKLDLSRGNVLTPNHLPMDISKMSVCCCEVVKYILTILHMTLQHACCSFFCQSKYTRLVRFLFRI